MVTKNIEEIKRCAECGQRVPITFRVGKRRLCSRCFEEVNAAYTS